MQNINLVTIDVWDTLIRRVCHPDAVKLHTCRVLLFTNFPNIKEEFKTLHSLLSARRDAEGDVGRTHKDMGLDDEYHILEVYENWLKKVLSNSENLDKILNNLYIAEIEQEFKVSYKDPEIIKILEQYPNTKKVFVSDFYMGEKELTRILKNSGYTQELSGGYSSCDIRLNKRSGRVFPYVLSQENIQPQNVLHIGDNSHSDVSSPEGLGIQTIHYIPKEQHALRLERESFFNNEKFIIEQSLKDRSIPPSLVNSQDREKSLYFCGIDSAPLFVGFILNIMEQSIKLGHDRIFFFTREGEFFKEIYDALAAQDPFGVPVPEAIVLEVSRVATFSASLPNASLESLMRIWTLYSTQSMQALFRSLDIEIDGFIEILQEHGISQEIDIQYPWLDERVQSLFQNKNFKKKLEAELEVKKNNLLNYLDKKRFPVAGKAAIVDIGWRGTIQDNLAHLLPNTHLDGFYLGLDKFLNTQLSNVRKYAFGPDCNTQSHTAPPFFSTVAPIEMLCNSPTGSVTGYKKENDYFVAEKLIQESENAIYFESVTYFQQGVISAATKAGTLIRSHAISSDSFSELAISCWQNIIKTPPAVIAETYFKLTHNESFGLGRFEDKSARIPLSIWAKGFISIRGFKTLVRTLEGTGWPEGYLSQRGLLWVWKLINHARQIKNKLKRSF